MRIIYKGNTDISNTEMSENHFVGTVPRYTMSSRVAFACYTSLESIPSPSTSSVLFNRFK